MFPILLEAFNLCRQNTGHLCIRRHAARGSFEVFSVSDLEKVSGQLHNFSTSMQFRDKTFVKTGSAKVTNNPKIAAVFNSLVEGDKEFVIVPVTYRSTMPDDIGMVPLIQRNFFSYDDGGQKFRISMAEQMSIIG